MRYSLLKVDVIWRQDPLLSGLNVGDIVEVADRQDAQYFKVVDGAKGDMELEPIVWMPEQMH